MPHAPLKQRFLELLPEVDVVSFDVFDTGLVRGVAKPTDIFLQVALEAEEIGQLRWKSQVANYVKARMVAERSARSRAWAESGWEEIRHEEIFAELTKALQLDPEEAERLARLECAAEAAHGLRNPCIGELYALAKQAGKQVGFLSDMYLEESFIAGLLNQAGYEDFDFLRVSSSIRKTKASGNLFAEMLQTRQLSPGRWLHIGDNVDSDVTVPRKLGFHTLHYPKCSDRMAGHHVGVRWKSFPTATKDNIASGAWIRSVTGGLISARHFAHPVQTHASTKQDFLETWGYEHAGPLLAGFGSWLVRHIEANPYRDVYFLARDGHLIKDVVDRLLRASENAHQRKTRTHYLYASRRAFNLAAIERLDEANLDFLVSGTSRMSPRQFLARIDIDIDQHLDHVMRVGFSSPDEIVTGGLAYGRLRALLRELGDLILSQAKSEYALLKDYFDAEGLLAGGSVAMVDLGWHGTLQNAIGALIKRMGGNPELMGYYLGTFPAAKRYYDQGMVMHGYLCEAGLPQPRHAAIRTCVEIFEWLFSAPHGSVCGFRPGPTGPEPIFADFAFEDTRWAAASAAQSGALRFIDDLLVVMRGKPLPDIPPDEALRMLHAALAKPTREEATYLGELQHAEGFGQVAITRYLAKPEGRLANPLTYPALLRGYRHAFWRPGFVRNLVGGG